MKFKKNRSAFLWIVVALGATESIRAAPPSDARRHLQQGNAYVSQGDYDSAIAHFSEALRLDSRYSEAYLARGNTYVDKGSLQEAIADFSQAIRLKPQDVKAYLKRADAYLITGNYDKAVADCVDAIRLDPKNGEAYYYRGHAYGKKGDQDKAIADYSAAIRLNIGAYRERGYAYQAKGDLEKAVADYSEVVRVTRQREELDIIIGLLSEIIRLDRNSANAFALRGNAYRKNGRNDKGVADLTEAIRLDPKNADAHCGLGEALEAIERWNEAATHFREALKINPEHAVFLNNLAWLLATCPKDPVRNGEEAVMLAQRADRFYGGKQAAALDTLAAAYAEAGRFPEAVATARKAVDLATQEKNQTLADRLRARLALYKAHKPFRQAVAR